MSVATHQSALARAAGILLLAWLVLLARPAAAQDDWQASVLGPYQGPVLNAGQVQQLDTVFERDAQGHLIGRYHVEDAPPFDGTLTDFHADGPQSGTFVWNDPFGSGVVHIRFDPALGRFTGLWGLEAPVNGHVFNGYRIRPPATS